MTDRSPLFTVFTPTYNRARTLPRTYASLRRQTLRDFEWLVVDDGSTDETADLVAAWQREADFPVRFIQQAHGGKHRASNRAIREAYGTLFIGLDSDDECHAHALEHFRDHWFAIPEDQRGEFAGVTGLCEDQHGEIVGDPYPHDPTDSDPLEIRYRYNVTGEKWGFNRTEVLRQHPLPNVSGQPSLPESLVWNRIARHYRTRYVNDILRTYHLGVEDSITSGGQARVIKRSTAFALRNRAILDEELDWFRFDPKHFLRAAVNYSRFSFDDGAGFATQSRRLTDRWARVLHAVAAPIGGALHLRDCRNEVMSTVGESVDPLAEDAPAAPEAVEAAEDQPVVEPAAEAASAAEPRPAVPPGTDVARPDVARPTVTGPHMPTPPTGMPALAPEKV